MAALDPQQATSPFHTEGRQQKLGSEAPVTSPTGRSAQPNNGEGTVLPKGAVKQASATLSGGD